MGLRARIDEALAAWLGFGKGWSAFWRQTPYMCTRRLNALLRHEHDRTVNTAWMAEYMARQKTLKPLKHYLKTGDTPKLLKPGEKMNAAPWLAMMGVSPGLYTDKTGQ